jgi:hypothetical protein
VSYPSGIVLSGSNLFVTNQATGTLGEYNATTGAVVNASLVSGLSQPWAIAVSGTNLFVTNLGNGTIGEYTTSGGTVNPSLVSGLNWPYGIAVSGSNLFVVNNLTDTIGEYTTSGGTVNPSLVSGLGGPANIAVTPEPSSIALLAAGAVGLAGYVWRQRRAARRPAEPEPQDYGPTILAFPAQQSHRIESARRAA